MYLNSNNAQFDFKIVNASTRIPRSDLTITTNYWTEEKLIVDYENAPYIDQVVRLMY